MFDIDLKPTFIRTVHVSIPHGRSTERQDFTATFEALDVPEISGFDLTDPSGAQAFLERVVVNVADVVDRHGNAVAFTPVLRDRLLALPWARKGLIDAYLKGFGEEQRGN